MQQVEGCPFMKMKNRGRQKEQGSGKEGGRASKRNGGMEGGRESKEVGKSRIEKDDLIPPSQEKG